LSDQVLFQDGLDFDPFVECHVFGVEEGYNDLFKFSRMQKND
jgi:hypothetical protein